MSEKLLKMGLIGAGRIGRLHAEHLTTRITNHADGREPSSNLCMKVRRPRSWSMAASVLQRAPKAQIELSGTN